MHNPTEKSFLHIMVSNICCLGNVGAGIDWLRSHSDSRPGFGVLSVRVLRRFYTFAFDLQQFCNRFAAYGRKTSAKRTQNERRTTETALEHRCDIGVTFTFL